MDYQCGHSVGRHHETVEDGYPICPKCLHVKRDELQAENKKLKAELERHRWIPVGERLPEENSVVLAYLTNGSIMQVFDCDFSFGIGRTGFITSKILPGRDQATQQ